MASVRFCNSLAGRLTLGRREANVRSFVLSSISLTRPNVNLACGQQHCGSLFAIRHQERLLKTVPRRFQATDPQIVLPGYFEAIGYRLLGISDMGHGTIA